MPPLRLVLASASPRRADLLTAAGFVFDRRPVDVDERPLPNESPGHYVRRVASEKSRCALETLDRWSRSCSIVLAADTAVVLDGAILGKPAGDDEAREMLRWLSGRRHEVLTGLSVRFNGEDQTSVTESAVFFAPLGDAEIGWLVQSGEGLDKAGSYAVQGRASRFITRIEGSYSNVVGLPVAEFWTVLRRLGVGVVDLAPGV
jgi:septum formation protein